MIGVAFGEEATTSTLASASPLAASPIAPTAPIAAPSTADEDDGRRLDELGREEMSSSAALSWPAPPFAGTLAAAAAAVFASAGSGLLADTFPDDDGRRSDELGREGTYSDAAGAPPPSLLRSPSAVEEAAKAALTAAVVAAAVAVAAVTTAAAASCTEEG